MHSALPPFLLIFDLDGILYRGAEVVPDAPASLARLREAGFEVAFLTNNSWNPPDAVASRLTGMGIAAAASEVRISAQGAATIAADLCPGGSVLAIGGPGVRKALTDAGLRVVSPEEPEEPVDLVVAGIDWHFTYDKLERAQHAIMLGATFIATNLDPRLPVENGRFKPGAGSLLAAIRTASGVEPILAGKPASVCIEQLMATYGRPPKQTLVIGDQLGTDILAGNRAGCRTALVLTGVSSRAEADEAQGIARPTFVHDTLAGLADALITEEVMIVRR